MSTYIHPKAIELHKLGYQVIGGGYITFIDPEGHEAIYKTKQGEGFLEDKPYAGPDDYDCQLHPVGGKLPSDFLAPDCILTDMLALQMNAYSWTNAGLLDDLDRMSPASAKLASQLRESIGTFGSKYSQQVLTEHNCATTICLAETTLLLMNIREQLSDQEFDDCLEQIKKISEKRARVWR